VRQPDDGPVHYIRENDSEVLSDKSAWDWIAMRRAKSRTLMAGAIDNKLAEIALRRGRALHDAANADVSALPPLYARNKSGKAVHSDDKTASRMDFSVSDRWHERRDRFGLVEQGSSGHPSARVVGAIAANARAA
jgi:hypothetical protein